MNPARIITTNPCEKDYNNFKHLGSNAYHCDTCNHKVTDISDNGKADIFDFEGKCVIASQEQIDELKFVHPLKRFAVAAFFVFGTSLFIIPDIMAQDKSNDKVTLNASSGAVTGRVVGSKERGVSRVKVMIIFKNGTTLETITGFSGEFFIEIPNDVNSNEFEVLIESSRKGKRVHSKSIQSSLENVMINDLGDIKIHFKQKRRRRGYTIGRVSSVSF